MLLVGLAVCLNLMIDPDSIEGQPAIHEEYERIRLRTTGDVKVLREVNFTRGTLFDSPLFDRFSDGFHIWGHQQQIAILGEMGFVTYIEFRTEEEAQAARDRAECLRDTVPTEVAFDRMGPFLILIQRGTQLGAQTWFEDTVVAEFQKIREGGNREARRAANSNRLNLLPPTIQSFAERLSQARVFG